MTFLHTLMQQSTKASEKDEEQIIAYTAADLVMDMIK